MGRPWFRAIRFKKFFRFLLVALSNLTDPKLMLNASQCTGILKKICNGSEEAAC